MPIETHRNAFNMTASVFGIGNVLPNSSVYEHNLPQAFHVLCFFITHFKYSVFKLSAKYHSFPVNLTTEFGNSVLLGMIFFEIIRNWVNNLQLFFPLKQIQSKDVLIHSVFVVTAQGMKQRPLKSVSIFLAHSLVFSGFGSKSRLASAQRLTICFWSALLKSLFV